MSERHAPAQSRLIWPPEPGLFRLRLVKGAWGVPARILRRDIRDCGGYGCGHQPCICDPLFVWQAEIDEAKNEPNIDPALARGVDTIWHGGLKIDQAEYDWLIETKRYAETSNPGHPCLHPTRPINRSRLRPFVPDTQQRTSP
jgi:hypothetical protein